MRTVFGANMLHLVMHMPVAGATLPKVEVVTFFWSTQTSSLAVRKKCEGLLYALNTIAISVLGDASVAHKAGPPPAALICPKISCRSQSAQGALCASPACLEL